MVVSHPISEKLTADKGYLNWPNLILNTKSIAFLSGQNKTYDCMVDSTNGQPECDFDIVMAFIQTDNVIFNK